MITAISMAVDSPRFLIRSSISSFAWLYIHFHVRSPYVKACMFFNENIANVENKRIIRVKS